MKIWLLIAINSKAQINHNPNQEKMKYFDIEKFKKNKGKQGYTNEYRYSLNNKDIREYDMVNKTAIFYIREVQEKWVPFNDYYLYYDNGILSNRNKKF